MKVVVVGAGVIGALTAYQLARQGAEVLVVDAGQPAGAASGSSFGWINASFHLDEAHFHLRRAGIEAHRRLAAELETTATWWQGCLCWEEEGPALEAQFDTLSRLGYGVRIVDQHEFGELEPSIVPQARALMFADEGAVDLPALVRDALHAAGSLGAQMISGVRITGIEIKGNQVTGVVWSGGVLACDQVVVATGVGTQALMQSVGLNIPMLDRPGLMMQSAPLPPLLAHILVTPEGELRQDEAGCILAPTVAAHQSDTTEQITQNPADAAARRAAEVSQLLQREVTWQKVAMAYRPVPRDDQPVMGPCGPRGLFVATMHSGATLGPLAAQILSCEVLERALSNEHAALVAPYRPQRFTT